MTVSSNQTIHRSWGGTRDHEGKASFSVTEHITTDDPKDGPEVVFNYFQTNIRQLGQLYAVGNDTAAEATLTNLAAKQIDPVNWHVVASYSTADEKKNDKDKSEKDPRLWVDEISVSSAGYQIPVRGAIYMGQWQTAGAIDNAAKNPPGHFMMPGADRQDIPTWHRQTQAVTNSAGTVYDPPLMKDVTTTVVRITRTSEFFDTWAAANLVNTLNKDGIFINRLGFKMLVGPETAKMISITGSRKQYGRVMYWEWTIEFHIDPAGWHRDIVDRGICDAKNADPEKNKLGVTKMATWDPYYMEDGEPNPSPVPSNVLIDDKGHPIREPVLLDGAGGVLPQNQTAMFLRYGIYKAVDWSTLDLDVETPADWLPKITAIMPGKDPVHPLMK